MKYWVVLLILLLLSCELDYGIDEEQEEGGHHPDVSMTGIYQIEIQGDQVIHLEAESAELYYDDGETRFTNVQFKELDSVMSVIRRGRAGEVIQYDNEDVLLKGEILVEDMEEDSTISAEELFWEEEARSLTAPEESWVRISWDEENSMQGWGFSGDFQNMEIRFAGPLSGVLEDNP